MKGYVFEGVNGYRVGIFVAVAPDEESAFEMLVEKDPYALEEFRIPKDDWRIVATLDVRNESARLVYFSYDEY